MKEIIQEIALLGLYRGSFFDKAAFYGGSALRIFYGIDRFSEDLDFSLYKKDAYFDILPYCRYVEDELNAFGFDVEILRKEKRIQSNIESAFIKAGTLIHFVKIGLKDGVVAGIPGNELLKIKLEIDTAPPGNAMYEVKYHLNPIPFHVSLFTLPVLFAGKVHALLCRDWNSNRIKGRDLYDYVWYLSRGEELHLKHLEARMRQTGHLDHDENLTEMKLKDLLKNKFNIIDYIQAREDVFPFLDDPGKTDLWSEHFFNGITEEKLLTV